MTNCNQTVLEFPVLKRRKVQAEFSGGDITSDGGVLLLRQIDRRLGL
ncbi:MAG: transposase, partial [Candidatus Sedimenticola sp. (ex Thyasira tokunagai)]